MKQPTALRLAEILEGGSDQFKEEAAAELRRLHEANQSLLEALKKAKRFMDIAIDWNLDEAEINGELRSTYDWIDDMDAAIAKGEQP